MKNRKGGFTLSELLTVIAILAVLLAVAVPAVITVRTNLKMRELDDTAREIFLAAQNSLTSRKAAGVPLSAGVAETGETDLYWLSSSDADIKRLLPAGAIEGVAAGNHYMIWYDAASATVLEVYYAESSLSAYAEQIKSHGYSDSYGGGVSHQDARRAAKIGYYTGGKLSARPEVEPLLPPMLTIENSDRLAAIITVPKAAEYAGKVELTVTVEELDSDGAVVAGRKLEFPNIGYAPTSGEAVLTLDSLTEGHFKDICPGITPGANIRATAVLSGGANYLSSSAGADTNSLFAGRGMAEGKDTLDIACPRHLQNLEPAVSGLPADGVPAVGSDYYIIPNYYHYTYYARQTKEIIWPAEADAAKFLPICNLSLRGYDGKGNEIKALRVDCDNAKKLAADGAGDSGAGLFGFAVDAALTDIRLSDPVLKADPGAGAARYVGALAGILRGTTGAMVSGCQVYASQGSAGIECVEHAGGLIGLAADNYTITGCSASLPKIKSSHSTATDPAYVGGLIGYAGTRGTSAGIVGGCYADTGWMGGKKWDAAYGMGGDSAIIGGLIGGTWRAPDAANRVFDCYALGWYSGGGSGKLLGQKDGAGLTISNCYSILQREGANCYYVYGADVAEGSRITALSELKGISGETWTTNGPTTPYHADVCPPPYPYPMLSGLRHYGDWPVQTVDGVKLFDGNTAGSKELKFIIAPAHTGTVEFWAQARNGEDNAMQAVTAAGHGAGLTEATTEYNAGTGRTKVTLTFQNAPGVTYVDLKAEDYTLRTVVVLYQATVKLNGMNTEDSTTAESAAATDGTSRVDTLVLDSQGRTGMFEATVDPQPKLKDIEDKAKEWQTKPAGLELYGVSAKDTDVDTVFAGWQELYTDPENAAKHDPAVTANGDPQNGTNILQPVKDAENKDDYYPAAEVSGGPLTVTGVVSGTAAVSARWAWDETVKADCEVKMKGARALIRTVSAKGDNDRDMGGQDNYPYRLDLVAEPDEDITLAFTPDLFGAAPGADNKYPGTYTWSIKGTSGTDFSSVPEDTYPGANRNDGVWNYTLRDHAAQAAYTVTLTYEITADDGVTVIEKSVDFMTFTVYRAAKKTTEQYYEHIEVAKVAGDGTFSGTDAAVEQITSNAYPNVDKLTLQGWVDGAGNTQVKWSYSVNGTDWTDVTGHNGSRSVFEDTEGGKRIRATVQWLSGNQTYEKTAGDGTAQKIATGGAIQIIGQDANEYKDNFTFYLKAEAVETMDDDGNPGATSASRIVTVTVLPRLQIDPQSAMTRRYDDNRNRLVSLTASRDPVIGWTYNWTMTPGEGTNENTLILQGNGNQTIQAGINEQNASATLTLTFGPHTASATIGTVSERWIGENKTAGFINRDGTNPDTGRDYFLVEKDTTRSLDFSWFTSTEIDLTDSCLYDEPYSIENTFSIELDTSKTNQALGAYRGRSNWVNEGIRHYFVTGKKYSYDSSNTLTWYLQQRLWTIWYNYYDKEVPIELYIIGMDVKQGDAVVSDVGEITMAGPETTADLTADWSFPFDLIKEDPVNGKKPTITWKISDPELVSFVDGSGADLGAEISGADLTNVTLKAHKYSADDYTVTLQATCRLTAINGREYTFTKLMQVTVKQNNPLNVALDLCTQDDLPGLQTAFPEDGLDGNSLLAAVEYDADGNPIPVLIRDPSFGCSVMYLKVSATVGEQTRKEDLSNYLCNIYANQFYADVKALGTDGETVYIRVQAKAANKDMYVLALHANIGDQDKIRKIRLYDTPRVKLTWQNSEGKYIDVTNGSYPISSADILPTTLNAELVPTLYSYGDAAAAPLDSIAWEMRPPADGYDPNRYLELKQAENRVEVGLRDTTRLPDFRVELRAYSKKSHAAYAGYALVFLPEEPAVTP